MKRALIFILTATFVDVGFVENHQGHKLLLIVDATP